MSSAPRNGPAASASTAPTPTSEATRSQRPRTSSPLRAEAPDGGAPLQLDDLGEQRPPDREPDRDREQDDRRGEREPHADGDAIAAE